jgi:threonine/homoserine/homoserine lactone efflux protein
VIYAVVAGLFLRFFDEILFTNATSPLVVVAIGSALGQVVGLARGATAPFAFVFVTTVVGTLACMLLIGRSLERLTPQYYEEAEQDDEGDGDGTEWHAT